MAYLAANSRPFHLKAAAPPTQAPSPLRLPTAASLRQSVCHAPLDRSLPVSGPLGLRTVVRFRGPGGVCSRCGSPPAPVTRFFFLSPSFPLNQTSTPICAFWSSPLVFTIGVVDPHRVFYPQSVFLATQILT